MNIREYGTSGPLVCVLHGGPGAPGYMAPIARRLADQFRVIEPLQRSSGDEPLTVARHIADLDEFIESRSADVQPALVGHSWGAMLALAYTAAHPNEVSSLVLIGCGTFDSAARERLRVTRESRMDEGLQQRLDRLSEEIPDPDERLRIIDDLIRPLDSYELISNDHEDEAYDGRAHEETWGDMVRLQEAGVYPAAFAAIDAPVIMLHGAVDPHPGQMIRASLEPLIPRLEYQEWERCGHYPWLEKAVREEFFDVLCRWLIGQFDM